MNKSTIYRGEEKLLDFICDKFPSLENKYSTLLTLDRLNFLELDYIITTIPNSGRNRSFSHKGKSKIADEFMKEFLKICDGSCLFGVNLYVK